MTCKHCGAEIADGAKFCENCGNKIETVEVKEEFTEPERVEADVIEEGPKAKVEDDTYSEPQPERVEADPVQPTAAGTAATEQGPIGYSIASLVCGILGLLCCCCGFFGIILSGAGIALGIVSINKNCEGRGLAIAGIACGGVGIAGAVIGIIASVATGSATNAISNLDELQDFIDSL